MDTLLRQWTLLKIIPRLPAKKTTASLLHELDQAGFPTTLRTIQRDLERLEPKFQISSDGHKPAGWFWTKDAFQFDIPGMTTHAALMFKMVQLHLGHLLPQSCLELLGPHFKQSERVLADINPQPVASWPEKVAVVSRGLQLQPPAIPEDILYHVYQGLLFSRQLKVMYRRRGDDEAQERIVNPLGLVVVEQIHYLVGTFWNYQDVKQLAIHRMEEVTLLDTPALPCPGFNLNDYVAAGEFGYPEGDGMLKLKVLFDSWIANQLMETPLNPTQKLTPQKDGRVLLEAKVLDTAQLRWWLQGFGAQVEVLAPQNLRAKFIEQAKRSARMYGL